MSTDRLEGEPLTPQSGHEPDHGSILALCDRVLGEAGRRRHLFGWLRAPGSAAEDWLPVDAYYPRNRIVVVCREEPEPHDGVFAELVPAHGLQLLWLGTDALAGDPQLVQQRVERLVSALLATRRRPEPEPAGGVQPHTAAGRASASARSPLRPEHEQDSPERPNPPQLPVRRVGPNARLDRPEPLGVTGAQAAARAARFGAAHRAPDRSRIHDEGERASALTLSLAIGGLLLLLVILAIAVSLIVPALKG
jgi:hypothetical protein